MWDAGGSNPTGMLCLALIAPSATVVGTTAADVGRDAVCVYPGIIMMIVHPNATAGNAV
jgi:hypothetical protein